jgi:copper(I)-binding protein
VFRSSSGKTVARRLAIGALALVIPALAGCEAGPFQYHAASGATYTTYNGISINDAFVLGAPSGSIPAGSSASMFLSLFNSGTSADRLVSVTATGASGSAAANAQLVGGGVNLPATSSVNLTGPSPSVVLTGLTKPLSSGGSIYVRLDFQRAGAVTIQVPVQPRAFEYSTFSPPPPSPSASPSTQSAKAPPKSPLGRATPTPTPTP